MVHKGDCGAPGAEIGLWRTAITNSARRTSLLVRLFGGEGGRRKLPPDFHTDAVGAVGKAEEEGAGGGVPGEIRGRFAVH